MGRLLSVVWMVIGIVLFAMISGSMASEFQEQKQAAGLSLNSVDDLVRAQQRVCSYDWMFYPGALLAGINEQYRVVGTSVAACGVAIQDGLADAVMMDSPMLKRYRKTQPWASKMIISDDLDSYFIATAVPEGGGARSDLAVGKVSPWMSEWAMTDEYREQLQIWFPSQADSSERDEDGYDYTIITPAAVMLALLIFQMLVLDKPEESEESVVVLDTAQDTVRASKEPNRSFRRVGRLKLASPALARWVRTIPSYGVTFEVRKKSRQVPSEFV